MKIEQVKALTMAIDALDRVYCHLSTDQTDFMVYYGQFSHVRDFLVKYWDD